LLVFENTLVSIDGLGNDATIPACEYSVTHDRIRLPRDGDVSIMTTNTIAATMTGTDKRKRSRTGTGTENYPTIPTREHSVIHDHIIFPRDGDISIAMINTIAVTNAGTDKRKRNRTETEIFTDLVRDVSVGVHVRKYKNYIFETGQAVFKKKVV